MRAIILMLTVYFGLLSIAPNMEGIQLFKFGALVHHFQQHQLSHEQFGSFTDFVASHYFSKHQTNPDERNLPFKTTTSPNLVVLHFNTNTGILTPSKDVTLYSKPSFYYKYRVPSKLALSVWHPPKEYILSA